MTDKPGIASSERPVAVPGFEHIICLAFTLAGLVFAMFYVVWFLVAYDAADTSAVLPNLASTGPTPTR